jgi:hypothetical protein
VSRAAPFASELAGSTMCGGALETCRHRRRHSRAAAPGLQPQGASPPNGLLVHLTRRTVLFSAGRARPLATLHPGLGCGNLLPHTLSANSSGSSSHVSLPGKGRFPPGAGASWREPVIIPRMFLGSTFRLLLLGSISALGESKRVDPDRGPLRPTGSHHGCGFVRECTGSAEEGAMNGAVLMPASIGVRR